MSTHTNAQAGPSRTSSPLLATRSPLVPFGTTSNSTSACSTSTSSRTNTSTPSGIDRAPSNPSGPHTEHDPKSPSSPADLAPPLPPFLARILATHHPPPQPSSPSYGPEARPVPQSLYLPPPAIPDVEEDLVPPENFALVCPGVYRSGFPKKRNFGFLGTLGLKTIL